MTYLVNQRIKWRFNFARAPWWGGFFEHLIAIMKRWFSKAIGRGLLDVECAMNNIPLCYQGEDFESKAVTPNIPLRSRPAQLLEEDLQKLNKEDYVTKKMMYFKSYKEKLIKHWMQEYLHAFKERERGPVPRNKVKCLQLVHWSFLSKIQRIEEHGRLAQYNWKFTEKMECFEDTRLRLEMDI